MDPTTHEFVNIFAVDNHPMTAAFDLPDKLVVKMPSETLQLLTPWAFKAHGVIIPRPDGNGNYGIKGFAHHPCMKWQYEDPANVAWLIIHGFALCAEFNKRYGKIHGSSGGLMAIANLFEEKHGQAGIMFQHHTPFALAMPVEYKDPSDPVQSYRNYLIGTKGYAVWKHGNYPSWWDHEAHKPARELYLKQREEKLIQRRNAKHSRASTGVQA